MTHWMVFVTQFIFLDILCFLDFIKTSQELIIEFWNLGTKEKSNRKNNTEKDPPPPVRNIYMYFNILIIMIIVIMIMLIIVINDNDGNNNTALIWQKEASDKSDISRKRAKCVCHLHWRQWNIMMSYLTYLLVGWVFLHEIWPGRRAHYVNYENIDNSNLDGMSLASFCQSRAEY